MIITVYSAKGSTGKTPIATNIALDREYCIGTNEAFHVFDSFIPDHRFLAVDLGEAFPEIPKDMDFVFDLAGTMSANAASIISAAQQSDLIIVPMFNELKSLTSAIGTINSIKDFGKPILVVATKLQKQSGETFSGDWKQSRDFINIERMIRAAFGDSIAVLPLKFSKVFDTIFERELSIAQISEIDPLARYTYKEVAAQFEAIYDHIDGVSNAK